MNRVVAERQGFEPWVRKRTTVFEFVKCHSSWCHSVLKRTVLYGCWIVAISVDVRKSRLVLFNSLANLLANAMSAMSRKTDIIR